MKKYRVNIGWGDARIEEVEVERETEMSIWINGDRHAKRSDSLNYFTSYNEAYGTLLDKAEKKVSLQKNQLKAVTEFLEDVKGLRRGVNL
jgi:hypothetical protein